MVEGVIRRQGCGRGLLFGLSGLLAMLAFVMPNMMSQSPTVQTNQDIAGTWQGTWQTEQPLRIILKISKRIGGPSASTWQGVFYSIDSNLASEGRSLSSITLQGSALKFAITPVAGDYEGKISADSSSITGTWTQGSQSHVLNLVRSSPATAWAIPDPARVMPANAKPQFEVATIKPSDPTDTNSGFHIRGRRLFIENQTMDNLLLFAYGVRGKQVVDGPNWFGTDHYDVDGIFDMEGQPSFKQTQEVVQKLLADRFKLSFHREMRDLPVYAVTIGKSGPKLAKSMGDPNGLPDQTGSHQGAQREIRFTNTSMADLVLMLRLYLDKPVVDQTRLTGRFDFRLKWTPDDSPAVDPDAAPGLFTAIQQQAGLKLESVRAPAEVYIIDHVERPTAN